MGLQFLILGPLEVRRDGLPLPLGPPKRRTLLAALLLHANQVVSTDRLVDCMWPGEAPPTARAVLQNHIHGLRALLGAARLDRVGSGYRLVVLDNELDALRFVRLVETAQPLDVVERAAILRQAIDCWRGEPLDGTPVDGSIGRELERLAELRLDSLERLLDADVALGRSAEVLPELEALVSRHPLREPLWRLLMLALYHSGRQADALTAYRRAHRVLAEEIGIEPGRPLKDLQRMILVGEVDTSNDLERAAVLLPMSGRERSRALLGFATAIARLGDKRRAGTALEKAADEASAAGDAVTAGQARLRLAALRVYEQTMTLTEYLERAREAAATATEAGDDAALAEALCAQGHMLRDMGRATEATDVLGAAAAAAVRADDGWQETMAAGMRVTALAVSSVPIDEVLAECDRLLETRRDHRPEGPIGVWSSLGLLHVQAGRVDRGRAFFEEAKEGCRRAGTPGLLAMASSWAGWAELIVGDLDAAEAELRAAYELCEAMEYPGALCLHAPQVGYVAALRGQLEEAERLGLYGKHTAAADDFTAQVSWRRTIALVWSLRSEHDAALALAQEGVAVARAGDWTQVTAECLEELGRARRRAGNLDGADRAFAEAADLYRAKGSTLCLERMQVTAR